MMNRPLPPGFTMLAPVFLVALCATGAVAQGAAPGIPAPGAEAAQANLAQALAQTDGSVDVVLGYDAEPGALTDLMGLLAGSSAQQVRFSVTFEVAGRNEVMDGIEAFARANEKDWAVCRDWWSSWDIESTAVDLRDQLGNFIFIDNGPTSGVVESPEADIDQALLEDPAYAGLLGSEPRRVTDPAAYLAAASAVWIHAANHELDQARQARGGWVDGC